MNRIMLDIEALGTRPGCAIATIGAVRFDNGQILDTFYRRIDLATVERHGLKIDPETMLWWMRQSPEAVGEITNPTDRQPLNQALWSFCRWCANPDPPDEIWCKGASYDFPMLVHAIEACGFKVPWRFSRERCYRTVAALRPDLPISPEHSSSVKHHALQDATGQASHLMQLLG